MRQLTSTQARNLALTAQGLTAARPPGRVDIRHFRKLFETIGLLQLDSVNVVSRSHYLPVLARLGPYDRTALDRYTAQSGEVFEYWGHEASLLRSVDQPLYRWRMQEVRRWKRIEELLADHPDYLDDVYAEIAAHGPLTVSDLADPGSRTGAWWGYGPGKVALEWLFATGRITAFRDHRFTRLYDLPERVLPTAVVEEEAVPKEEAYRRLLMDAARHHGVGTMRDLADYHRLHVPTARPIFERIVASGALETVAVKGWDRPAYLHPEAKRSRRPAANALLSPFDPVVWYRDRTERLFDFHYRIEIYVPAAKRIYGYYVLPFLMDGELVGRVDLKADRSAARLLVQSAHIEPGHEPGRVSAALATELHTLATWSGLDDIEVKPKGDLAGRLGVAVG